MYELLGKLKVQIPSCNVPLFLLPRARGEGNGVVYIFFWVEGVAEADIQKNCYRSLFWSQRKQKYRCYYQHRSKDSLSLICGIFHCTSGETVWSMVEVSTIYYFWRRSGNYTLGIMMLLVKPPGYNRSVNYILKFKKLSLNVLIKFWK